jgi:hypothetical protein
LEIFEIQLKYRNLIDTFFKSVCTYQADGFWRI